MARLGFLYAGFVMIGMGGRIGQQVRKGISDLA
jgi:hypothetical protein